MNRPKIMLNRIVCQHCGDVLTSEHVHDFKYCSCRRVFVDGGLEYLRRGFREPGDYVDLSVTELETETEIIE